MGPLMAIKTVIQMLISVQEVSKSQLRGSLEDTAGKSSPHAFLAACTLC